ncbi:hypothetical protein DPX16_6141 [Anabarilius grahami]|uniref:Uncharacterized protein n=1 Tax=Anabarilius grahami TaxID=495550 RepID=A0A3N0Z1N4_ANAGA|nr:hypothetical protein DPX16_6141 [Anabarilius grahami]
MLIVRSSRELPLCICSEEQNSGVGVSVAVLGSTTWCTEGLDSFFRIEDNRNRITVKPLLWRDAEYRPGQTGSEWTLREGSLISEHKAFRGPGDREMGP